MSTYVKSYIKHCHACQVMKASHQKPLGLLRPLQIPSRPWSSVSMDLITALPSSSAGNDCIFVIVDRFTKMCHFEACQTTITATQLADLFCRMCWRHHGLPEEIVSDRDPRFTARFWQSFWKSIGTNLAMSSAYHPQTDGQTERANRTLEQMLRFYVDRQLSNWDELLLCCEFAYNNSTQASTGQTPFFLNYGLHPLTPVSVQLPAEFLVQPTRDRLTLLHKARQDAKEAIAESQKCQKRQADRSRRDVTIEVGQKVLLKLKGRPQQKGPAQKLRPERAGPFRVSRVVQPGVTMQLDMSRVPWKGLDIFHVSQLSPYFDGVNIFPSRTPESVQPCDIAHLDTWEANDVEYTVEDVKAARTNPETKAKEWLVSWQGYAVDADSWIQDSQMNDLLRAEAEERKDELWAEGKRMAKLEKSTLGHRQRNKDRRKSNKTSARGH
jgi:transposase InsO family protein